MYSLFSIKPDEFWQHHYRFEEATTAAAIKLGHSRQMDLILNVIIPVVMLYARVFSDSQIRTSAREVFSILPTSQKNVITRKVEKELFKGKVEARNALQLQGVLQLYRLFCAPERCSECVIGQMVF
jgi:hypothetical protein